MNSKITDIMGHKEGNFMFPFLWPDEANPSNNIKEIQKIYESGCKAFCIEARPFEDYAGGNWWRDVGEMIEEARRLDMKVWFLDDKHFPTGYANGLIEKKYPELRRHYLREHHIDVMGPQKQAQIIVPRPWPGDEILYACAWKRSGEDEELCGEPIAIEVETSSEFVYFDVPEGCWRVFIIYNSPFGAPHDHRWYINMLSKESVHVLIEAVYEEHYKHFSEYFGNTILGFFSDEPSFGCEHMGNWGCDTTFYYRTIGRPGVALPWDSAVADIMKKYGIEEPLIALPALWYSIKGKTPDIRLAYMNSITTLWNENFSYQIGDWCRDHGVKYIGHIIEDQNAHSRIGGSSGHYFRGLSGQDMSGIDIVLHQVRPSLGAYKTAAPIAGGVADPDFFHYVLANLASSLSRIEPRMQGRAMCEVFGAYGWAEGAPTMKWLIDFLLIRGVNHFVPHAFSAKYPFEDCPPHFYGGGKNPQFKGFTHIAKYANRVSHLLSNANRHTDGAIFYYAENEWMSKDEFMYCDAPAKALYDAHIDYDIIPLDAIENCEYKDKKIIINGHSHSFFIIPQAKHYPRELEYCVNHMERNGIPVYTLVEEDLKYPNQLGICVTAEELIKNIRKNKMAHDYKNSNSFMRIAHFEDGASNYFMFFNEDYNDISKTDVKLPIKGKYVCLDLLNEKYTKGYTEDGHISVTLCSGESKIYCFGDIEDDDLENAEELSLIKPVDVSWDISIMSTDESEYRIFKQQSELLNITGKNELPDFSGYIKYNVRLNKVEATKAVFDLGEVGQTAELYINGEYLGMRVCRPYKWDISKYIKEDMEIKVIVSNTLANKMKDHLSTYMPIPPSGIIGPVNIIYNDLEF